MVTDSRAVVADMTVTQLDLARHALGADSRDPGFRNHFCATPGTADDSEWRAMVAAGAARLLSEPSASLPCNSYAVDGGARDVILGRNGND